MTEDIKILFTLFRINIQLIHVKVFKWITETHIYTQFKLRTDIDPNL